VIVVPEPELERLKAGVTTRLGLERSAFVDELVRRTLLRWPPVQEAAEPHPGPDRQTPQATPAPPPPAPEGPPAPIEISVAALDGGLAAAETWITEQLGLAMEAHLFQIVLRVAVHRDGDAFQKLMNELDSLLRLRGLLYRHGLDPEQEHPGLWGRIWEAIPKWDGRDFRAYVGRIVRNHCLDEIARKKKAPVWIGEDEPRDRRPSVRSATSAASQDAMGFVMDVLADLETDGRIKALDHAIMELTREGRAVADILEGFNRSPVVSRLVTCLELLAPPSGRARDAEASLLRLLAEGLTAKEVAGLTGRPVAEVANVASALGPLDDDDDRLLARCLIRAGISTTDLRRARGLNANALNLILNRIRLKLWMAVCDRAFEALVRRGRIDPIDEAIEAHRCTHGMRPSCRMYKDRTCKREAAPEVIARKAGLDVSPAVVDRAMTELRRKVVEEGIGFAFPDYDACMTERKPDVVKGAKSKKSADGDDAETDAS